MDIPEPMKNIMVTFIGSVRVRDKYYDHYEKQQITKRGFFHKSDTLNGYYNFKDEWIDMPDGYISVPPSWQHFKGVLLPHGWGGYKLSMKDVIKWEYCKD